MPSGIEWLNENANRAFPFKEDVSRTSTTGVVLPNNLVVDLAFVVPADVTTTFYLSQLVFSASSLTIILADDADTIVGSLTVDLTLHSTNQAYDIVGQGTFQDARGRIALGDLSRLNSSLPEGIHLFTLETARFEMRTVRPDLRSVRELQILNPDGSLIDNITGIARLIPGTNIRITFVPAVIEDIPDPVTGTPVPTVTTPAGLQIDAIAGENLNEDCPCETTFPQPDCIRTLNGVEGDENGNITLESVQGCLQINAAGNQITFQDDCANPCCGCAELEFIVEHLNVLEASINTLESRSDQLQAEQVNFRTNVLGSIL